MEPTRASSTANTPTIIPITTPSLNNEGPSSSPARGLSERSCRLLAGLDAGIAAALAMAAWLLCHSWMRGEYWWAKFNVLGAVFYGSEVYSMGRGRATLAGACLFLLIYALLGALYGLAARKSGIARNLLLATGAIFLWQALLDFFLLKRLETFAPAYLPRLAILPGHLFYALCLTRFPLRFRSISREFGDPNWATPEPPPAAPEPLSDAPEPPPSASEPPPSVIEPSDATPESDLPAR